MQTKTKRHLLLLTLIYIILIVLVNPMGNFPVNDDWAFARSVLLLAEEGEFHLLDWGAMTLLSQVVWGALWVKLFGFSFEVLRFSTIVLGFVALVGSYYLLLGITKESWVALTGTGVLLVNPLFIVLANSFMTDVPFLALSLWSAFFLLRAIERDSVSDTVLGLGFAIVALLLRQIALVLPLAFLFGYIAKFNRTLSIRRLVVGAGPFFISMLAYLGYIKWLKLNDNIPRAMTWSQDRLNTNIVALFDSTYSDLILICKWAGGILMYVGLFSLPMMLVLYLGGGNRNFSGVKKITFWIITGMILLIISFTLFETDVLMPVHYNLITSSGIGPFTLRDVFALGLPHLDSIPRTVWQLITAMSVLGALLLGHRLGLLTRDMVQNRSQGIRGVPEVHWREIYLCILIAAYVLPLLLTDYFDRYLLFLLPFVFSLVALPNTPGNSVKPLWLTLVSVLLIPIYGYFSVALAHDYMSWNRTRTDAINWVRTEHKLDYSLIDGGFEINGFYGYDPRYESDLSRWVKDDKYIITFGEVPGYLLDKQFAVERTLPIGPREIMVLRRLD